MRKATLILIAAPIVLAACTVQPRPGPGPGPTPAPARPEAEPAPAPPRPEAASNPEINAHLAGLKYDPRQIFAEQVEDPVLPAKALPDEENDDGDAIIIVKQVKHRLSGNLDDVLIVSPTHSVIWPGALVKADQDLVRGTPTARSPSTTRATPRCRSPSTRRSTTGTTTSTGKAT